MPDSAPSSLVERDAATLLRCPECHAAPLSAEGGDLGCPACGAEFPGQSAAGVCSLMARKSVDHAIKEDIRKWWGDLYGQIYAQHETELDEKGLDEALDQTEDLFRKREHLCTNEMPLDDLAGKSVLEIGPGAGGHCSLFKRRGASVVAADITPERVASTARKLAMVRAGEGRAYQADAENLPFKDDSFDIVYSNGVLHHSDDTEACVAEVLRVLRPGGRAVIMLYSRHSAIYWLHALPLALITGRFFGKSEAHWMGSVTEGKPKLGETRNPVTRVYSEKGMRDLFSAFTIESLRKSSFQFDNFCIPKLTQIRFALMKALGSRPHPGGYLVYGADFMPESRLELALGRWFGFAWNIVAEKPGGKT